MPVAGNQGHDGVEVSVEAPAVLVARAGRQGLAPARQDHGAPQQRLHARGEDRVTGIDGELAVSQLVREADLPLIGVTLLGSVEVRSLRRLPYPALQGRVPSLLRPDHGTVTAHDLVDHGGAPAVADDVDHHLLVLEHPVPAGHPVDPDAGLVRTHDPRPAQPSQDGCRGVEAATNDVVVKFKVGKDWSLPGGNQTEMTDGSKVEIPEGLLSDAGLRSKLTPTCERYSSPKG